jgi:hypothetical protein
VAEFFETVFEAVGEAGLFDDQLMASAPPSETPSVSK